MAYNDNSCLATRGNTGLSDCLDDLGYDYKLLYTTSDFEIDTEANAKLEATYLAAINAGNMSPMPAFEEIENTSEDDVEQELATGVSLYIREGKYSGKGNFRVALCNLAALRTYNELKGRAFIVTSNGKIFGTSPDGVKFKGFELSKLHISTLGGSDGSTVRWVSLSYQLKNPTEMGDFPAVPDISAWNPTTLTGIKDVTVTVSSSAAGLLVVDVSGNCDGDGIEGLVEADFLVYNDAAASVLPSGGFTDNEDGTYDFVFDAPALPSTGYSVNLKSPSAQTTGQYESAAPATFTIS